ncbi:hypothetical protein EniyanLRS_58 [Mycobacterium phage EniyanLRS]|uniref:Uncharacterized protein n=1 Tax=Mycobacterium phage EniyanLRS TaxID=1933770 RepID=A0A2I2MPG0_9CAUD|nr:hypothetical protein EniyanLRS_58 [Mycobacterium phage EniyanLRS]WKR36074.1 hypothetical protein [Mycobacterium phage Azrael100]
MPNKQLTTRAKLKRKERELGVKATDNPDDVRAVLQTARRLLADGDELLKDGWQEVRSRGKPTIYSVDGAVRKALDLAHPHNRDKTWWAVKYALENAIHEHFPDRSGILHFNGHPDTTLAEAITVFDSAIKAMGRIQVAVSKAKGR